MRFGAEGQSALHKPAQGKRGTSAALGWHSKNDKALKGLCKLPRPLYVERLAEDVVRMGSWGGL
jgi:hypothetical protein